MQNLVACGGGNLGASAALNPKRMQVGWTTSTRCRGGKYCGVLHRAVKAKPRTLRYLASSRRCTTTLQSLMRVVLPPREDKTLNPKP